MTAQLSISKLTQRTSSSRRQTEPEQVSSPPFTSPRRRTTRLSFPAAHAGAGPYDTGPGGQPCSCSGSRRRSTPVMEAASYAAMSDPDRNRWFRRRWTEPPDVAKSRQQQKPEPQASEQIGSAMRERWCHERATGSEA